MASTNGIRRVAVAVGRVSCVPRRWLASMSTTSSARGAAAAAGSASSSSSSPPSRYASKPSSAWSTPTAGAAASPSSSLYSSSPSSSSSFESAGGERMVFGSFKVHKTRGAIDVSFVRPRVQAAATGKPWGQMRKPGGMRLEFAPSVPNQEHGYDWRNKLLISLSVTEIGDIIAFDRHTNATEVKFFHDPNMGSDDAGKVRKELVIKRNGPGRGYFFTLTCTDQAQGKSQISVSMSEGEFAVFIELAKYGIPHLLCLAQLRPTWVDESGEPVFSSANSSGNGGGDAF